MTREEVVKRIRWSSIIWLAGIVNVGAMLPQLWQIIKTHETKGLSLGMIGIYLLIQIAFSLQGFFRRDKMLMWCLGLSALVSTTIILVVLYLRNV